jgi:hypothetical protein
MHTATVQVILLISVRWVPAKPNNNNNTLTTTTLTIDTHRLIMLTLTRVDHLDPLATLVLTHKTTDPGVMATLVGHTHLLTCFKLSLVVVIITPTIMLAIGVLILVMASALVMQPRGKVPVAFTTIGLVSSPVLPIRVSLLMFALDVSLLILSHNVRDNEQL